MFNSRLEQGEERINEHENRTTEIESEEQKGKKKVKKIEENKDTCGTTTATNKESTYALL